jgi:hypothetical protein
MASNNPNVVTGSAIGGAAFQVNARMLGGFATGSTNGEYIALAVAPVAYYSDNAPTLYLSASFADNSGSIIQAMNKLAEDISADSGGDVTQLLTSVSGTMPMYTNTDKQIANSNLGTGDGTYFGPSQASLDGTIDLGASDKEWKDLYVDGVAYLDSVDIDAGNIDGTTIGANSAAAGTFEGITSTTAANSLGATSFNEAAITNVGDLACDSISVDAAGTGLNVNFGGATTTGVSLISIPDNLDSALNITQGSNSYIKFASTNSSELITFGENSTFASTTIADLGTVTTATSITSTDLVGTNIDGIIGADTARAGTFTTLIGTNIDGPLGDNTPAAVIATTISASSTLQVYGTSTFEGSLLPSADDNTDIGSSAKQFKDLYVDGIGYIDQLGTDADSVAAYISSGKVDGAVIGSESAAAGTFTTLIGTTIDGTIGSVTAAAGTFTTATVNTSLNADADGGADIGTTAIGFGDVYVADDKYIQLGSDQDYKIGYDETTRDGLVLEAKEGAAFKMYMMADNGDDAGDEYSMNVTGGGMFMLAHDKVSDGTQAATLTITPGASAALDVAAFSGIVRIDANKIQASDGGTPISWDVSDNVTVGGDLTITGNNINSAAGGAILTFDGTDVTAEADLTVDAVTSMGGGKVTVSTAGLVSFGEGEATISAAGVGTFGANCTFGSTTNSTLLIRGSDAAGTAGGKAYKIEVVGGILKATQQ